MDENKQLATTATTTDNSQAINGVTPEAPHTLRMFVCMSGERGGARRGKGIEEGGRGVPGC